MQETIDKLKKIGFKKIPTEKGFTIYELSSKDLKPGALAALSKLNSFDSNFRAQAPIKKKIKR